jgi:hypothetical protein
MTIIGKDGREMIVLRAASLTDGTIVVIHSTTCRERRGEGGGRETEEVRMAYGRESKPKIPKK